MAGVVTEMDGDGDALRLWKRLWALAHGLDTRSKQMAATIGVTAEEWLVLRFIRQQPRCTPKMAATALNMQARTINRIVKELQRRRYVTCRRDPEDQRRVVLALTSRALRIDRDPRDTVEAAVRRTLQRLDAREIARSAALLELLAGELRAD
jgi:DNA-binding MarR family transcriptional regulator